MSEINRVDDSGQFVYQIVHVQYVEVLRHGLQHIRIRIRPKGKKLESFKNHSSSQEQHWLWVCMQ